MADAEAIGPRLAAYLEAPLSRIAVLASGWETTVFETALVGRSPRLPEVAIGAPLVLRFYEGNQADDKGAREAATMRALSDAGYAVPRPYLYEPDRAALGAPFLIMQRVRGGPLFAAHSFPQAFRIFSLGFIAFVRSQVRLHRLPLTNGLDGLPCARRPRNVIARTSLIDRTLAIVDERIDQGPLPGLRDAYLALQERAAHLAEAPDGIVHLDYHPQNAIVSGVRVSGIIDWVSADRGDRHLCAATTSVILASSAMDHPRWMRDNAAGNTLRALFTALYLPLYHALAPMEIARFRYCQAVAALHRLSMFGLMRKRGAEAAGFRREAISNVTPDVVRILSRYTSRKTKVHVSID